MNEHEYLASKINEQLRAGSPIVLVSIVSMQGSTPRHSGVKMAVGANGQPYGTIGGSLIEATVIQEAKNVLAYGKSKIISFDLSSKDVITPDMICGGKAEILMDYIPVNEINQTFSQLWYDLIHRGQDFYLVTHLKGAGNSVEVLHHAIIHADGNIIGNISFSEMEIESLKSELHNISSTYVLELKDTWVIIDRIRKMKTLYCFGAGHVAVPTAHLAALVGFRVVVIDDRPDFANTEHFPEANDILVISDFNNALEELEIDGDSFIVILTRGHQYDRVVLEQSLKTSAGYIGMISSKRKREAIYTALLTQGVEQERLEKVYSPIGIDIGGETPEEIAVSIVAELIKVRSQKTN